MHDYGNVSHSAAGSTPKRHTGSGAKCEQAAACATSQRDLQLLKVWHLGLLSLTVIELYQLSMLPNPYR